MYTARIEIPQNTPERTPVSRIIQPTIGIVKRILIRFPAGCAGLVGCKLTDRGAQFAPISGWIEGDGVEVPLEVNRKLDGPPREVVIYAYNEDDTYPHTIEVRIM